MYIGLAVLLGVIGAALRTYSIMYGTDLDTGLLTRGAASNQAVRAVGVLTFVVTLVLSRMIWPDKRSKEEKKLFKEQRVYEETMGTISSGARTVCIICGAAMCVVGAISLFLIPNMLAEQTNDYQTIGTMPSLAILVQHVMYVLSGITLIIFAKRQDGREATKSQGNMLLPPMIWACLNLIILYHENSSNPVMQDFAFELVLSVVIMAAFYSMASIFFCNGHIGNVAWFSGLSVFLLILCVVGTAIAWFGDPVAVGRIMIAPNADICRLAQYICAGIYLLAQLTQIKPAPIHELSDFPTPEPEEEEDKDKKTKKTKRSKKSKK